MLTPAGYPPPAARRSPPAAVVTTVAAATATASVPSFPPPRSLLLRLWPLAWSLGGPPLAGRAAGMDTAAAVTPASPLTSASEAADRAAGAVLLARILTLPMLGVQRASAALEGAF